MKGRFVWNEWNIDHIAEHGVVPVEAEFVVRGARPPFPEAVGDGKLRVRGKTRTGRWLNVILIYLPAEAVDVQDVRFEDRDAFEAGETFLFVIHARDLTETEMRALKRRRR
jgi:hypothetical protein